MPSVSKDDLDRSNAVKAISIPVITEADLSNFHASHFASAPRPYNYFVQPQDTAFQQEQDDGLGWYEDGVKRTLTDEQIEMFRHSEMMQLAREQRTRASEIKHSKENTPQAPKPKTRKASPEPRDARNKDVAKAHSRPAKSQIPYDQRHKRKWEGYVDEQDPRHGSMTHRRLARELDGKIEKDVKVDYGDETSSAGMESSAQQTTDQQRRVVSYADD